MKKLITDKTDISEALGLGNNADQLAELAMKHQPDAMRYLRARLGNLYDDLVDEDETAQGRLQAKRAEAMLSLSYALPFVNFRITESGGLSRLIGMTAGDSREELMSAQELKKYAVMIRSQAIELLQGLNPNEDDSIFEDGAISMIGVKGIGELW